VPRELRDGEADALSESDSTSQPWARDPSKKRGEKILINHSIQVPPPPLVLSGHAASLTPY